MTSYKLDGSLQHITISCFSWKVCGRFWSGVSQGCWRAAFAVEAAREHLLLLLSPFRSPGGGFHCWAPHLSCLGASHVGLAASLSCYSSAPWSIIYPHCIIVRVFLEHQHRLCPWMLILIMPVDLLRPCECACSPVPVRRTWAPLGGCSSADCNLIRNLIFASLFKQCWWMSPDLGIFPLHAYHGHVIQRKGAKRLCVGCSQSLPWIQI